MSPVHVRSGDRTGTWFSRLWFNKGPRLLEPELAGARRSPTPHGPNSATHRKPPMLIFWLLCVSLVLGLAGGCLVYREAITRRGLKLERAKVRRHTPGWQSEWAVLSAAEERESFPPPPVVRTRSGPPQRRTRP